MNRFLTFLLIFTVFSFPARLFGEGMDSYVLQWRYINNFIHYVQWPVDKVLTDFRLCIVGPSPFGDLPDVVKLNKQRVPLLITEFSNSLPQKQELEGCHIAYFDKNITFDKHIYVLNQIKGLSVLSISDRQNFTKYGGLIEFVTKNKKLRFIIDGQRAKNLGVVISPALLRLSLNLGSSR